MALRTILLTALLFFIVESGATPSCVNATYFSGQLELMLAEYERAEPPPGAVRVRAALDVQHATIDDRAATVRLLAAMHLVGTQLNGYRPVTESGATPSCVNATYFSGQLELMLAEYERAEPPPGAVRVRAALDVQHATIDDRAATVRLLAAMHLNWEDKRLSWNASSWGCHNTVTSSERLWLPDVNALNAVTRGNAAGAGMRARLSSEGRVAWIVRYDLTSPLALALDAWPRDVQEVTFKFGSRHHGAAFNLSVEDFSHATVFESGTWELVKVSSAEATWRGGDVVSWSVTLRRRAAAHALAAGSVLAAAVLLLLGAALLPPAQRPALCATAAFIASLWLISALSRLPGAARAPQLMRLMCAVCACAALQCAGAALTVRVARAAAPPPAALRTLVTAAAGFCKLSPTDGSAAEWSAWAAAAQLLDRALLGAALFTLFVVVCMFLAIP